MISITSGTIALAGTRVGTVRMTNGGVTTYYYCTTGGARGSTTSVSSIPVGAVIERRVTT